MTKKRYTMPLVEVEKMYGAALLVGSLPDEDVVTPMPNPAQPGPNGMRYRTPVF